MMGFGSHQLRDKALLALEDAVQECRYTKPPRTMALRFALAYLWAQKPGSRAPYEAYWQALATEGMSRFSGADQALSLIYQAHAPERDHGLGMRLWFRRQAQEQKPRREPPQQD